VITSEPLIELEHVSRKFRLRPKSRLHLLALLGLNFGHASRQDFWAVRDVSLSLNRGTRLGIIGRNGAGKSTLLKLIAGILAPTEGTVRVRGRVETLMQLGAGFHPEFTGRDNVIHSLAYRGITRRKADRMADDIIEFAELEEFQNNQLKTYSSGMAARLGFAAATAIVPEVLIIDEILGAGDAYFAAKSFDRMRQLTSHGTTVLFVSHDMSSVELLCDEAIWMERGRVRDTGTTQRLSRAYAREIREREKQRLKARNAMLSASNFRAMRARHDRPLQFITRVVGQGQVVQGHGCALLADHETVAELRIGDAQDIATTEAAAIVLDRTASLWGPPKRYSGRPARAIPAQAGGAGVAYFNLAMMELDIEWRVAWTLSGGPARIEVFDGTAYRHIGDFTGGEPVTETYTVPRSVVASFLISEGLQTPEGDRATSTAVSAKAQAGETLNPDHQTGEIELTRIDFENEAGKITHLYNSFDTMRIRIGFHAKRDMTDAVFVACFYREGICALQTLSCRADEPPARLTAGQTGEAVLEIPSLPLGRGLYLVSVAVFPRLIFTEREGDHIAYVLIDRQFQIRVEQPEGGLIDLGIARGACHWRIESPNTATGPHFEDRAFAPVVGVSTPPPAPLITSSALPCVSFPAAPPDRGFFLGVGRIDPGVGPMKSRGDGRRSPRSSAGSRLSKDL
jgi:lipopolysaccharide transport system ATP-binding protein